MKITFGQNASERAGGAAVVWDFDRTINPHGIVLGDSGAGKTHMLKRMMRNMLDSSGGRVRIHVLDGHGDISLPGESLVRFSETTDFGLNPFVVDPDPDFGGVYKRINSFISTVKRATGTLGSKQVYALRNLLLDLYAMHGFQADDPASWYVPRVSEDASVNGRLYLDVPFEEKDVAKAAGASYDPQARAWWINEDQHKGRLLRWGVRQAGKRMPTLIDVLRFARKKQNAMFFATNTPTTHLLEDVNRRARQLLAKEIAASRRGSDAPDAERLQKELDALKQKTIESFSEYVSAVRTGRELEDMLKYDSKEVMQSVVERLDNLLATGIFRSTAAPYEPRAAVWRRDISPFFENLGVSRLFVDFELENLLGQAVRRGVSDEIRDVVILDEADRYTSDDPDHIINRIVKEARKYGLALIMASQAPTHFSEGMLAGVAVRVVMALDPTYYPVCKNKLAIDDASLATIIPWQRCVVQMKNKGERMGRPAWVQLPNERAAAPARAHA